MSAWNLHLEDVKSVQTPMNYLDTLCGELYRLTNGKIIARVREYNQPFAAKENSTDFAMYTSEYVFRYEMFITSKRTPGYYYKVFTMNYDVMFYPVELDVRSDIAKEIGMTDDKIYCQDDKEFRKTVDKIIGSKTMGIVLTNLAALNGVTEASEEEPPS